MVSDQDVGTGAAGLGTLEMQLTAREQEALAWLEWKGGSVLITVIEDGARYDIWNDIEVPSKKTIKSLIKKGLVIQTEEEEDWTPTYDLVERK